MPLKSRYAPGLLMTCRIGRSPPINGWFKNNLAYFVEPTDEILDEYKTTGGVLSYYKKQFTKEKIKQPELKDVF